MIIIIVRDLTGGIRKHIVSILSELIENKKKFIIITNLKAADYAFNQFLDSQPVVRSYILDLDIKRSPGLSDIFIMLLLCFKLFKYRHGAVFHGHGAKGGMYARIVGRLLRCKTIYTPHGGSVHKMHGSFNNFIYYIVERFLFYFSDQLIFESQYTLNSYKNMIHRDSKKFLLNYNGVEFDDREVKSDSEILANVNPFIIGAFGALRYIKGYDILLSACAILIHEFKYSLHIKIYGSGEKLQSLNELSAQLKISKYCEIGLATESVMRSMKECSLIVQPSRFESFGYTALEAQSLMVPVISSNAGGLTEIVIDNETGLVFSSENSKELATKIKFIIDHPEARLSIVKNAYLRSKAMFNEHEMTLKLMAQYI